MYDCLYVPKDLANLLTDMVLHYGVLGRFITSKKEVRLVYYKEINVQGFPENDSSSIKYPLPHYLILFNKGRGFVLTMHFK